MDDDCYRRGKKTTHAVYGEAIGILAGDALLNYAFETASRAFLLEPSNPAVGKAFSLLASKAGVYGMVGGQVVDVEAEKRGETAISREKLDFIYRLKTGALIEASMMIGAILADAPEAETQSIGQVAADIGLAFQIQDDILDVTSSTEVLGKPVGSDEKNEKSTYVTLEGLEKAAKDVERFSREAADILKQLNRDDVFLQEMIQYLVHRNK
jgi:geranylgeranyl diphosphate synthase type II